MRKHEVAVKKPALLGGQRYACVKLSRFHVYLWKDKFISWPVGLAASYSPRECMWIIWIYVRRMRRLASSRVREPAFAHRGTVRVSRKKLRRTCFLRVQGIYFIYISRTFARFGIIFKRISTTSIRAQLRKLHIPSPCKTRVDRSADTEWISFRERSQRSSVVKDVPV